MGQRTLKQQIWAYHSLFKGWLKVFFESNIELRSKVGGKKEKRCFFTRKIVNFQFPFVSWINNLFFVLLAEIITDVLAVRRRK